MRAPKVGVVRTLVPVMMDACDARVSPWSGRPVRVVQPYGCPKNGTMGMCYVEDVETGRFIGLVCCNSLRKDPVNLTPPLHKRPLTIC